MKNKRATSASAAAIPRSQIVVYCLVALISLAGLADATYLTAQAFSGETMVCGGSPDCFKVLGSPYAHLGSVPLALVGAIAYFSVFSSPFWRLSGTRRCVVSYSSPSGRYSRLLSGSSRLRHSFFTPSAAIACFPPQWSSSSPA